MAFSLTALYSAAGATSLSDSNPFRLENAEGLSGAEVARHAQRSPNQSGVTDLGYRLQPRTFTLSVLFYASDAATLDGHRDTLMGIFRPFWHVNLRAIRDDGDARFLTCYAVDEVAIDLVPEHRPGNLHRATITLRAANPLWLDGSVSSASKVIAAWWTGGGQIAESQVRDHVEAPGNAQSWTGTGNLEGDWAVAVATTPHTGGSVHYAWRVTDSVSFRYDQSTGLYYFITSSGTTWAGGTVNNAHFVTNESAVSYWKYWDGTAVATHGSVAGDVTLLATGAWRGKGASNGHWTPAVSRAVIFSSPTTTQMRALVPYLLGSVSNAVTAINSGDVPSYPYIALTGPLVDPVLTNQATGGTINLTGLTLGSADTVIIDMRTGDKRLTDIGGNNLLGSVTVLPMSIADFYLAPAPQAVDGHNIIAVTAGSIGATATIAVQHTNWYLSV